MKRLVLVMVAVLVLAGCLVGPGKFTIPDEPQYKQIRIYRVEGGICLDPEGIATLWGNVGALRDYAAKLRKILEGLQRGE